VHTVHTQDVTAVSDHSGGGQLLEANRAVRRYLSSPIGKLQLAHPRRCVTHGALDLLGVRRNRSRPADLVGTTCAEHMAAADERCKVVLGSHRRTSMSRAAERDLRRGQEESLRWRCSRADRTASHGSGYGRERRGRLEPKWLR
jgi:hypothetical protein